MIRIVLGTIVVRRIERDLAVGPRTCSACIRRGRADRRHHGQGMQLAVLIPVIMQPGVQTLPEQRNHAVGNKYQRSC